MKRYQMENIPIPEPPLLSDTTVMSRKPVKNHQETFLLPTIIVLITYIFVENATHLQEF